MATPSTARRSRRSPYKRLPLWAQWAIPFAIAGLLVGALIYWVRYETNSAPLIAPVNNPKAVVEQNREARILIGQEQTPHVVQMTTGQKPAAAIHAAALGYMTKRVSKGVIAGPVQSTHCTELTSASTSERMVFKCVVKAASVNYPFEGVVQPSTRQVTYCKRDPPPIPSMSIPLSKRCT